MFLAIEGVAMAAEEAKDPKRSIPTAYITVILTLVLLVVGVMLFAELIKIGGQTLTANVVTMAMFGAILTYIMNIMSLFKLRRSEPAAERPFIAPFFSVFPAFALLAACVCLGTMVYFNPLIFGLFVGFMVLGHGYFLLTGQHRATASLAGAN